MLKVCLINPPFAALQAPSFALTQLQELVRSRFGPEKVDVSVHYLNIDFAGHMGLPLYEFVALSMDALHCGLGDWFFRSVAFPESPENAEEYFMRYGHHLRASGGKSYAQALMDKRETTDEALDAFITQHELEKADVVGFTSMFQQNVSSFAMARKLKIRNPGVVTVIGGANCESPMGEQIAHNVESIDYVFSGPALVNFPQFLEHLIAGEAPRCGDLDGVILGRNAPRNMAADPFKVLAAGCGTGLAAKSPIGKDLDIDFKFNLDFEPFLVTLDQAFGPQVAPVLFFETSRGCWWGQKAHCTFCGLNGSSMNYRAMSPALAIEQFNNLFRYSDRVEELQGVDNILPKSYLTEVLPFLDTPANMKIFYEVKADLSDHDMEVLAKARVLRIQPGIEALATSTLKLMRKGTTAHQNIQFLKNCVTYGVEPAWNLLIGFPGEEESVYRKYASDLPLLMHLPPPSGVFPIRFDRFSPYFFKAAEYKLDLRPLEFYELVYPFPEKSLQDLACFFADENALAAYSMAAATWVTRLRERVGKWKSLWNGAGPGEVPVLHYDNKDRTLVLDTRSGSRVMRRIDPLLQAVLQQLGKPRRVEDILKQLPDYRETEVSQALASAREQGLVFEEEGRYSSLVLLGAGELEEPFYPIGLAGAETAMAMSK